MSPSGCDFSQIISKSIDRSLSVLFRPFSFKKWFILLFIAWLAGALGSSGGNFNFGNFDHAEDADAYPVREGNFYQKDGNRLPDKLDDLPEIYTESSEKESLPLNKEQPLPDAQAKDQSPGDEGASSSPSTKEMTVIGIIGFVIGLPLILLFGWLSSRFKFIWYEAIVNNQTLIVEPFKKYKKEGNSLFVFYLLYGLTWWAVILVLGGISYLHGKNAGAFESGFEWSFGAFMGLFGWQILLFILFIIAAVIFVFLIDHLLVPIMAMDRVSFGQGIRSFGKVYRENTKNIWLFVLISFGLSILCGIFSMIAVVMIILVLGLATLILFGLLYVLTVALLKMKIIFAILAVMMGVPYAAIAFLLLISVSLPFGVFYRHLSLYLLSSLSCGYAPLPLEPSSDDSSASPNPV